MPLHIHNLNVYCPECPPGATIGHPGGQQKTLLSFGHGRDLAAFNGTGLQNKDEISKSSGPIHYTPTDPYGVIR